MAKELILAALTMSPYSISEAIDIVDYTLKNYYKAYKHHRKKKMKELKEVEYFWVCLHN
jgi:hypothetical protein